MRLSDTTDSLLATRDRYFVPCVMAPFAEEMARRLGRLSNGPVLEIVSDTGALTQAMAASLSAGLTIIATDPDQAAVRHASAKPGMSRVNWQTAQPHALPFHDATFGIVACLFAATTFPDRVATFKEVRRVMKPGARFLFGVPGHLRQNSVADCVQTALDTLHAGGSLGFIRDGLHGYADSETIDDDLTEAGFTDAIYSVVDLPFAAASAREVAVGYCLGTPLRPAIERQFPHAIDSVTQALENRFGAGKVVSSMRAQIVSAAG